MAGIPGIHVPSPLTAQSVFNSLRAVHREIVFKLKVEGKTTDWTPAWYAHLPSGEKIRIRWFEMEGSLVLLRTPEGLPIVLAPEAVAITVEPLSEDTEGFPVEFLDKDDRETED